MSEKLLLFSLQSGKFFNTMLLYEGKVGRDGPIGNEGILVLGGSKKSGYLLTLFPVSTLGAGLKVIPFDTTGNESASGMLLPEIGAKTAGAS